MSDVKDIPFTGEKSGLDELSGASPYFTNALVDRANVIRARPGIAAWGDFPAAPPSTGAVTMMIAFQGRLVYTTADGQIFAFNPTDDSVASLSLDGGNSLLEGDMRPTAAATGTVLVIVAGGAPQKVSIAFVSSRLGGSPPSATGIAILTRRIVLSKPNSGEFDWSGVLETDAEVWDDALEFEEAEARNDNLVTLSSATRELYAFGEETVETFAPDQDATFSPTSAIEVGTGAARSVVRWNNMHAWVDDRRRIVMSDAHDFDDSSIISKDIQNQLEGLTVLDDAWGFRLQAGQHDCLGWVFPTEGRVFAVEMSTKTWSQWHGWTAGRLGPWKPTSFYYWREKGLYLVGLANGTIARLSFQAYTDLGDPIFWRARSGFVDHGVGHQKAPLMAHFQFRRGGAVSSESSVGVTWRDDLGGFVPALSFSLGTAGDVEPTVEITPAGASYHQRQWELSSTAADAIAMVAARETFDTLEVA